MKLLIVRGPAAALLLALGAWLVTGPAYPGMAAQDADAQQEQTQQSVQRPTPPPRPTGSADRKDVRLPNGKMQREEILKDEYQQNVKDAQKLAELSQQLRDDLEKGTHSVLSVADLRKTDEIEKLAKKIRDRMRR